MAGIKDTVELVVALRDSVRALRAALKDGKLGLSDLPLAWDLRDKAAAAADGMRNIPAEVSDLDVAEIKVLVSLVVDIGAETWGMVTAAAA